MHISMLLHLDAAARSASTTVPSYALMYKSSPRGIADTVVVHGRHTNFDFSDFQVIDYTLRHISRACPRFYELFILSS
jgi:hypothetical protein